MQLYLALSAVLASGGQQPLTALQEADAELAALVPDSSKSKVAVLTTCALLPGLSMTHQALRGTRPVNGFYALCLCPSITATNALPCQWLWTRPLLSDQVCCKGLGGRVADLALLCP